MRHCISNLLMTVIIPTKLKQMQSDPKDCIGEIFHKYLGGLQMKKIRLDRCCYGTLIKFSQQITELVFKSN